MPLFVPRSLSLIELFALFCGLSYLLCDLLKCRSDHELTGKLLFSGLT